MSTVTLRGEPDPAGKFARTRRKGSQTGGKLYTSDLVSMGNTPITVTTEISPIIEVLNMADYTHNTTSVVPVTEPIFQASPSSITIRKFEPQTTVQVELLLRNNDTVARRVKILKPESEYFKVTMHENPGSKIAPGMYASYTLNFTPEERLTDYFCDLVCCTEREKFIIPVKALGPRGWIDLPDEIEFENPPVKAVTTKTILVRNMGATECTFKILSLSPSFNVSPVIGTLMVSESVQLHFSFLPENMAPQEGEFQVSYSSGEIVYIKARGIAQELSVRLDSRAILMDPTYVSLFSQKTFRIINRSEHTVSYSFKQFATASEEVNAKARFSMGADQSMNLSSEDDFEFDYSFKNDSFSVSPSQGELWPNAETEITVTFTPSTATEMACVAFCDITGKEHRLPLQLQGTGIGPRIVLSYNVIDIGEVFINSVSEYDVDLVNQGDISAAYELVPSYSVFGSKFKFEPCLGTLLVGQKENVKIAFSSDVLGDFEETFEWALLGTPQPLILTLRGRVIGPTFHIDQQMLDFRRVSVAFLCTRHFHLFNTSDIPFRFHLRVPGDGVLLKREFELIPATGTIIPHGKQKVQVDFIPLTTRVYNLNVVLDIEGVGEQMATVSMKAESVVPDVTVSTHELNFGDCFLRYAYKKVIELVNHSNLPAKFELQPQDEISRCVAKYEVDYPKGVIDPFQQRVVTVSFSTERLDKVQLPMFFRVVGHDETPLEVQCIANGIGPNLSLNPGQIKWGDIPVLHDIEKTLKVKNESLIPATFGTLIVKRNSRFRVNVAEVTLAPGETANIKVTANLDDVQNFKDDLCIVVTEGGELTVPLTAKGIGTTIRCPDYDLGAEPRVDLGFQFTTRVCKKSIVLTNEGPKPQVLTWVNGTALAAAAAAARQGATKEDEKKKQKQSKDSDGGEIFRVEINGSAEPFTLDPGASCTMDIIGSSRKVGPVTEKLCCRSKTEKEQRVIIELQVFADFVDPSCEFSVSAVPFEYNHNIEMQGAAIQQFTSPVTLKNTCSLPLEISMKCSGPPFSIDSSDVDLKPGESATLQVMFEPGYKSDRMSEVVKQNITFSYNMGPSVHPQSDRASYGFHPKRGTVDLTGSINYPNLKFDKTDIKFGAILNDTTKRIKVKCTNTSSIQAIFSWAFVVTEDGKKRPASSSHDKTTASQRNDPSLQINSVFDILPIRSSLQPGQTEDVEFVFFGHANHKYKAIAVCEVQGGPEYEIKLEGEASSIQYKFDRISLEYGNVMYDKFSNEELVLFNTGKVKFDFVVNTDSVVAPTVVKAVPATSTVPAGDKVKIQIQFYPGMPISINSSFSVEVAHFDPQIINITGKGIFPHVAVNLPRKDPARIARLFTEAQGLVGMIAHDGSETARTEGMPMITARTAATADNENGHPAESPIGRRNKMSMEMFLQSNPYVRQLLAEADCLGMREFIMDQIRDREQERESLRAKVLLESDDKRQDDASGPRDGQGRTSRPASVGSSAHSVGPSVPQGPGAGENLVSGDGANVGLKSGIMVDMESFILSEYICDFGNVIKGSQATKSFRVTNVGFAQISFEFSKSVKSLITSLGFIIEPDRVNRLPGAPDFESVDFSVVFNSSRPGVNIGPLELLVPLQIKSGPQVSVLIKANVTFPDVELSTENLKFGPVFCGHCRTVSLQLTNCKEIPANWVFSQALLVEGGAPKPTDSFTVVPDRGSLNPGESCNVQIVAVSESLAIRFDPPLLELDPILPFVVESEKLVTVYNDTDTDIEFFSLDFDPTYLEEETILRKYPNFQNDGLGYKDVALLPLRAPGKGLQKDVIAVWDAMRAEEEAARKEAEKLKAAATEGNEEQDPSSAVEDGQQEQAQLTENVGPSPTGEIVEARKEVGQLMPIQPSEPDLPTVSILVFAHPQAGGRQLAKGLAMRYRAGIVNINKLVADMLVEAGVSQFMETVESEEGEPPKLVPVPGKYVLDNNANPSPVAKALQEVFFPPVPVPEEGAPAEAAEADAGDDAEKPPEPRVAEVEDGWLTKEMLAELIKARLISLDCIRGVIFEDLQCQYLPDPATVAQAIELALPAKQLHLALVEYQPGEAGEDPVAEEPPKIEEEASPPEAESEAVGEVLVSEDIALDTEGEIGTILDSPETVEEVVELELGPEETFTEEELQARLQKYEETLQAVINVFEPPKPEEGEEAAADAGDNADGEKPPVVSVPVPSLKSIVRLQRMKQQNMQEVVLAATKVLPEPGPVPGPPRKLTIPAPFVREIVVRPSPRLERRAVRNFYILTPVPDDTPTGDLADAGEDPKPEGEETEEANAPKPPKYEKQSRWTIAARSSMQLLIRMKAEDTGRCEALLGFEIAGGGVVMFGREFMLPVRGMCAFPQISQNYQSIYYRKIKSRAEGQIVSKQYIVNKNIFEFGPLLVGKSKEDYMTKYPENQEKFRITNNGLFNLHVDFCFKEDQDGKIFVVEPPTLDLLVDETQDITVYAFTEEEGEFSDKLICNIKDNPEPMEINLACVGSIPKIVTDIEPPVDEEGNPQEGTLKVEFQRLLLKRKDTRIVTLTNPSFLPAKWRLLGVSEEDGFNCGKELSIFPTEGTLGPSQSQELTIGFHAIEKAVLEKRVTLEWVDVDGLLEQPMKLEFDIVAEAYEIDLTFSFPSGEGLDFEILKVAKGGEQTFTITNNGKYEVGYRFAFARPKRSIIAQYIRIETVDEGEYQGKPNGVLASEASAEIKVIFESKEEVYFKDNVELKCYFSELLTGEEIPPTTIKISVRSVFSKYRALPQKGISFGALTYDTQKTRTFEIVNQGEFEFNFEIACITNLVRSRPGTSHGRTSVANAAGEQTADGGLKFGNFTATPASGTVQPNGEKQTISVLFEATGQAIFSEVLGIQISDRDPAVDPNGMAYELSGESCIPGILTSDFLQIFEEAAVWRKAPADPNQLTTNTFIEEDRVFHFGPRLVDNRVEVRVKIVNPTKVPVTVDLTMTPKGSDPDAFAILEKQLTIPMHEHRYATMYFTPKGLLTYTAEFEASVVNGIDERTNRLVFEVRGDGTLPRVSIREPAARNEAGQALMNFNRLLVGKTQTTPVLIVNEGILPATVRFSRIGPWPPNAESRESVDCFSFSGRGAEVFLNSKEERRFELSFRPKVAGENRASLEMIVLKNEFERNIIELKGEGFTRDVSFENMPEGTEDELKFGQLPVGFAKQLSFTLSNNSSRTYRFSFPTDAEEFTFVPCVGHIQPSESKSIVATVRALKPLSMDARILTINLIQIEYVGDVRDWDDSMKDIDWVLDDGPAGDASLDSSHVVNTTYPLSPSSPMDTRKGKRKPRKVVKVKPEPEYAPVLVGDPPAEGEEDSRKPVEDFLDLKVSLDADFVRYAYVVKGEDGDEEVGTLPNVVFTETMMYRTRVHSFRFKNVSKAKMDYKWKVYRLNGEEDDDEEPPFSIEPQAGTLNPGGIQEISVKFSPTEVDDYSRTLVCEIDHLSLRIPKPAPPAEGEDAPAAEEEEEIPEPQARPEIALTGRSARPLCHFELAESDWLKGGRRPPTLATPNGTALDPSSRCVEFESLGTQVRNTKRFFVMNPTNVSYKFRWECEDGSGAAVSHIASAFKCVHKEGVVLSGKKSEMVFEYTPDTDILIESFWRFLIPEHGISVPFILVGHVKEPNVFFDKTFCNFSSLLLHHKTTQVIHLVNKEHIPFAFAFDGRTYGADEDPPVIRIHPASGTIAPESELAISVQFTPKLEKNYNFNAVCNVKKKATRLAINIKGEGFDTHCQVAVEDERGSIQIAPGQNTPVDFGDVHVNETRVKTISLLNTGKYPIEFEWKSIKNRMLTIKPELGSVGKGEKTDIKIAFHPLTETQLSDHAATMQVINGPKFPFSLSASGRKPLLNFSFRKMDFGPCFLYRHGAKAATATLRVTNEDSHDIGYVVLFDNQPYLELDASPTSLVPGQSEEIKITFMPREVKSYTELIPFEINGLYRINLEVIGSGHECDIALANPAQFNYALGAVKVGSVVEKRIKVKNSSPVSAECNIEESVERLGAFDIRIRPTLFTLRPRETTELELIYTPTRRMPTFTEDLVAEIAGHVRTLVVLNGSAVGIELKLDTDMIFFGAVVAHSRTTRRVQLENVGDIGTKWRWAPGAFQPNFSVEPLEGFLNPHDEITLDFAFHPSAVNDDVRRDNVPLYIEGADPLSITLTGICVLQEPHEEVIEFSTPVRSSVTLPIPAIENKTDQAWRLRPVIVNDFWTGPEILEIPPRSSVAYNLTYRPLSMTARPDQDPAEAGSIVLPEQHTGSVFVPVPDGTAVMYKLVGIAGPPEPEAPPIVKEVPCKAFVTEYLAIRNWLARPQRFTVRVEPQPEGSTTLKCASYIDVPANTERNLALKFQTFVEGSTQARVTFRNDETGEYLVYDVEFNAATTPVLDTFDLATVVRQEKELEISLSNPLDRPVTLTATCDSPDVVVEPQYELRAKGETPCRIVYRPLLPCQGEAAEVRFSSAELGDFIYGLRLKAAPAGTERQMQFKAAIGTASKQTFRFRHYLPRGCSYSCETDNPVFSAPAAVSAAEATDPKGVEVEVEVTFEPDFIGEAMAKLQVHSDDGGDYVCILHGHGLKPQPQGPVDVPGRASVEFKNPFSEPKSFTVAVDNEAFSVVGRLDDVAARSAVPIAVAFRAPAPGVTVPGKLTIVCEGYPPWIYYLKGS